MLNRTRPPALRVIGMIFLEKLIELFFSLIIFFEGPLLLRFGLLQIFGETPTPPVLISCLVRPVSGTAGPGYFLISIDRFPEA